MYNSDFLIRASVDLDEFYSSFYYQVLSSFEFDFADGRCSTGLKLYLHERYGRFGNNVYQLLHAIVIARHLHADSIDCNFHLGDAAVRHVILGELVVRFGVEASPEAPVIRATLFLPNGFGALFKEINFPSVKFDSENLGRSLFYEKFRGLESTRRKKIIFHFRSGDVFMPGPSLNSLYVQPPLSYYILALNHICETTADFDVYIVYESDSNPCIREFKRVLDERQVTFIVQSDTFLNDASTIATADVVVSSFGTFCEALALMNENIQSWYAFRTISAHEERMRPFLPHRFSEIMRHDGVDIFLVEDTFGEYIPIGEWDLSASQIDKLINYPISNLRLVRLE